MISRYDLPICTIMSEIMFTMEDKMHIKNIAVACNVDDSGKLQSFRQTLSIFGK